MAVTQYCSLIFMIWLFIVLKIIGINRSKGSDATANPFSRSAYTIVQSNKRLVGHVVTSFVTPSLMSCHQSCLRNAWCTSTNFKESFNRGDKTMCELNVHQLPSANIVCELVHQPGVTFAMFFKGCQISGCLNGGSCLFDTEKKSFFCLCKQPWNGSNCEIKTSSSTENASRSISSSSLVSFSPSDSARVFQPSSTSANAPQHISPATTAAVYSSANQSLQYISSSPSIFQSSSSTVAGASQSILNYTHYAFTTLGAKGSSGPNSTSGYAGTVLESQVSLSNGIQMWSVPVTGCYVIEATGASGANGTYDSFSGPLLWKLGGLGAKITGTFQLSQGVVLKILVGQEGEASSFTFGDMPGGGGGGSYVSLLDNTPLIVAGGGGGGGTGRDNFTDGDPGQAIVNGSQCGGSAGAGGKVCDADTGFLYPHFVGGGGAGLYGNGGGGGIQTTPYSFIHGGDGGTSMKANGGFGGGASALYNGGGGGGYSGGGLSKFMNGGTSGGGGSFNGGTNQRNIASVNKGDGKVIISLKT